LGENEDEGLWDKEVWILILKLYYICIDWDNPFNLYTTDQFNCWCFKWNFINKVFTDSIWSLMFNKILICTSLASSCCSLYLTSFSKNHMGNV
jgi:hypothetical protein